MVVGWRRVGVKVGGDVGLRGEVEVPSGGGDRVRVDGCVMGSAF
jgi:hypothetical protein